MLTFYFTEDRAGVVLGLKSGPEYVRFVKIGDKDQPKQYRMENSEAYEAAINSVLQTWLADGPGRKVISCIPADPTSGGYLGVVMTLRVDDV